MKRTMAAIVIALVLLACGDQYNGNATIVSHDYDPPSERWQPGIYIPGSCSGGYGSTPRYCSPPVNTPGYWRSIPEEFLLHVEWTDEDGKHHTATRSTSRDAYNDCPDGRIINLDSMKCPLR